jgi:hypothetical protein
MHKKNRAGLATHQLFELAFEVLIGAFLFLAVQQEIICHGGLGLLLPLQGVDKACAIESHFLYSHNYVLIDLAPTTIPKTYLDIIPKRKSTLEKIILQKKAKGGNVSRIYPLHLIGSFGGRKSDVARQFDLKEGMATNFGDGDALDRIGLEHARDQIPRLN